MMVDKIFYKSVDGSLGKSVSWKESEYVFRVYV